MVRRSILAAALILLFAPAQAEAGLVTWTIAGTVEPFADPNGTLGSLGLVTGAPYTYSLVFESSTPGFPDGSGCTAFNNAIVANSFVSGAFSVALPAGSTESMGSVGITFTAGSLLRLQLLGAVPPVGTTLPIAPPVDPSTLVGL